MKKVITRHKFLLLVGVSLLLLLSLMMLFTEDNNSKQGSTIFGSVKVKSSQESGKKALSKYQAIKQEGSQPPDNTLRYKVKVKKENPFLSLYREKPTLIKVKSLPVKETKAQTTAKPVSKKGLYSVENEDLNAEKRFFKAIFRETQQVQPGKALRIILAEPIPSLHLKAGTILKGVPSFSGERIMISITAGIVSKDLVKLDLTCYDQADYLAGLYHDELASQLAEATQEGVLEEILDLEFKGKALARKATQLTKLYQPKISIEKGREIFVAMPDKEAE
jgi:hypothetical protein